MRRAYLSVDPGRAIPSNITLPNLSRLSRAGISHTNGKRGRDIMRSYKIDDNFALQTLDTALRARV